MRSRICSRKAGSGGAALRDRPPRPARPPGAPSRPRRRSRRRPGTAGRRRAAPRGSARSARPRRRSGARRQPSVAISDQGGLAQRAVLQHLGVAVADAHGLRRLGHREPLQESQLEHAAIVLGQPRAAAPRRARRRDHRGRARVAALVGRLPAGRQVVDGDQRQAVEGAPVVGDRVLATRYSHAAIWPGCRGWCRAARRRGRRPARSGPPHPAGCRRGHR